VFFLGMRHVCPSQQTWLNLNKIGDGWMLSPTIADSLRIFSPLSKSNMDLNGGIHLPNRAALNYITRQLSYRKHLAMHLYFSSSPREAIALSNPTRSTPSFSPSPAVIAVLRSSFTTRRLSSIAATNPVAAPIKTPNTIVRPLLSMTKLPFVCLSCVSRGKKQNVPGMVLP
jgi:hypothetical protein